MGRLGTTFPDEDVLGGTPIVFGMVDATPSGKFPVDGKGSILRVE